MKLREYQQDSIDNLRGGLKAGHMRQLLMLVTGGGKTVIAGTMIKNAMLKNKRVWFIVDNLELVQQALDTFDQFGLEVGVIQGIHERTDYRKPVQIITAQTLTKRWAIFDQNPQWKPDLIFIDEGHVQYKAHKEIVLSMAKVPVVGLSATPFSKGLGKLYDHLVVGADIKALTDLGYLTPTKIYAPFTPDLKGVKTSMGDWQESGLEEKMNNNEITADIVSTWFKLGQQRQTIVFCVNVAHSKHIYREFQAKGVSVAHIDGYMDKDERKELIAQYKAGLITVLTCVTTLTKGFDAPNTGCLVIARPTKSLMLHYQCIGRGLRIAEGKENCIILDHSGNIQRNGFPDDILPTELCNGEKREKPLDRKKREKKDPLPEVCTGPGCKTLKPAGIHKCPECGFAPEKQSTVEVIEGELKELKKANQKRNKNTSWDEKINFIGGLKQHARNKGYSEGWVAHKYKDRFSVWPNDPRVKGAPAIEISQEVKSYLTSQNIRNAKKRAA